MAAETGIPSVYLEHQLSQGRASKKGQESIIEKLRHKNSQIRSWDDSIKSVWSFISERKAQTEKTETSSVQQCLDTLQKAMKVTSQQILKERFDLIGRQLGLNMQIQDQKVSLGTDVFHVEVLLGEGGTIANVKLANQGDVVDCPDLRDILIKRDFTEFTEHLKGLQSIYQVTNDEKLKSKAFLALQALEKDLHQIAQFQSSISGVANYIHKCPLGIMLPRLAGKPMKLIYFVSPYDLLDKQSLTAHPLTVEAITENFLGQSVTVCIESVPEQAPSNKLQTMPLMNVNKTQDGKSLPSFSAVTKINSMNLPASFVLVLPQSVPVSLLVLQKITSHTGLENHMDADPQNLCALILESFTGGKNSNSQKLFVSLPDQQHMYFLDGLNGNCSDQLGVMVSRIPFTHPTHVPQILNLMRQQLLFNIVIASCIRLGAKKDEESSIVFEVTGVSLQHLTVVCEHPAHDSMITVDIDLSDITNLKCRVSCVNSYHELCSDEAISRVFQRCMSIPITLRWLIGKGRGHLGKLKEAAMLAAERERLEKALFLKEMQHRQAKLQPTTLPANRPPPQPPHPPPLPPPPSYPHHHHSPMHIAQGQFGGNGHPQVMHPLLAEARNALPGLEEFQHMAESNNKHPNDRLLMSTDDDQAHNPLLSTLLDEEKLPRAGSQTELHDSPMLSRLLDEKTSVATTVIPMNCKITTSVPNKRQRKRRVPSEFSGPSPKRVIDSVDHLSLLGSPVDLDMDQSLPGTPTIPGSMTPTHGSSSYHHHHHHHHHPMLNHVPKSTRQPSNVIDLTEVGSVVESSLKKLADSVDKHFTHKDVKVEPDLSMLLNEAETDNRIPNILQNSPSGSKNENASTSLEGILKGSGEVGRAKDFDPSDASPVHSTTAFSKLSSLLLASSDSPSANLSLTPHKNNNSFFSDQLASEDKFGAGEGKSVSDCASLHEVKPSQASLRKATLHPSSSMEIPNDRPKTSSLFEKFDPPRQQQPNVKTEPGNSEIKPQSTDGKVSLKLRVPLKNSAKYVKSFNSVDESDLVYGQPNRIGTFDFKSDEEEDDQLPQYPPDRYVYSSSPTCLQISSSKQKRFNDYVAGPQKSDKTKKRDKNSGNMAKRKREKEESKREKKRRKNEHFIQESVYTTVENTQDDFKLKIRVAKKPVVDKADVLSDGKVPSYEIKKRSLSSSVDKLLSSKQEQKEPEQVVSETVKEKQSVIDGSNTLKTSFSKLNASVPKSSQKSGSSKSVQGGGSSGKTDPKLVTKATIRLKPLMIPNSGSTVNISQSGTKISNSVSGGNKLDRRSSTSVTTLVSDKRLSAHNSLLERRSSLSSLDRRNTSQSSSQSSTSSTNTTVTPPSTTSANLSLSSILPNVPTISKIASLPRIPKLSSSSSNTSISRTSSLDPASGSVPTSAGTKSNNSYTVGPAGRPNPGATSGQGGRFSSGTTGTFNYNSRPNTPNAGSAGSNRPNFSANRPNCPVINSSPGGGQRPPGPRPHNPSVGANNHRAGISSANSHKPSGSFTPNSVKAPTGSSNSPNLSQKTHGSSASLSNSNSSKVSSNIIGQKMTSNINSSMSGQRHISQNALSSSSSRTSSGSSSVCRSPNTSALTKSPNSGKSPNITNSSRSPSLTNASKSPNITAANKSPNTSSSTSGRSPSINSSKSPNTSSTARPGSSLSSKSPVSVAPRHSSSVTKPSGVIRSTSEVKTIKCHASSPLQKSVSSSTGNTKPSSEKPVTKTTFTPSTTAASSSTQRAATNCKPATVSTIHAGSNNKIAASIISTISLGSSSSLSVESLPMSNSPVQKSLPAELPVASVPSVTADPAATTTTSPSPPIVSLTKSSTSDHSGSGQDNKGSQRNVTGESKPMLPEKSPIPPPSTPIIGQSTDPTKSSFSSPTVRGRKNSLSAIVDKLKHNAVGVVSELPAAGVITLTNSSASVTNKTSLHSEQSVVGVDSGKLEDVKSCSTFARDNTELTTGSERLDKKQNNLLVDNIAKAVCDKNNDGSLTNSHSLPYSNSLQSESSDKLVNANCEKSVESKCNDLTSKELDSENGHGLTRLNAGLISEKEKALVAKPDCNIVIEKPTPLKMPAPQQPFALPCVRSPLTNSCITSSPQISPFQPSQSPGIANNSSPLIGPSANMCPNLIDSNEQVFKMPTIKSSDGESKPFNVPEVSHKLPADSISLDQIIVNHESSRDNKGANNSEKTMPSSKPLSSPLSDISSPENGLIIDDEDSLHFKSLTDRLSSGKHVTKLQSNQATTGETNSSINQPLEDIHGHSPNNSGSTPVEASPKTSWPLYAKSPTLSKSSSGASVQKDSDSPCQIDDDLMDVALGIGS